MALTPGGISTPHRTIISNSRIYWQTRHNELAANAVRRGIGCWTTGYCSDCFSGRRESIGRARGVSGIRLSLPLSFPA